MSRDATTSHPLSKVTSTMTPPRDLQKTMFAGLLYGANIAGHFVPCNTVAEDSRNCGLQVLRVAEASA